MMYKSKFESTIADQLLGEGMPFRYELYSYEYELVKWYTPDWFLANGMVIESKGKFTSADRTKHLAIREAHPDLDIRFVFMRDNFLRKGSKTRYSDWCNKHDFLYAIGEVPRKWLKRKK